MAADGRVKPVALDFPVTGAGTAQPLGRAVLSPAPTLDRPSAFSWPDVRL